MKKFHIIAAAIVTSLSLCGCGALKNENKEVAIGPFDQTNNAARLYDGQYYIWHDEEQSNIEKDIQSINKLISDINEDLKTINVD